VLTPDRLLTTADAGRTFTTVRVPVPSSRARAAYFRDADDGYVISARDGALIIARTSDGGRRWQVRTERDTSAPHAQYDGLQISFGDPAHGTILAATETTMNASTATIFAPGRWRLVVGPDGAGRPSDADARQRPYLAGRRRRRRGRRSALLLA
jgi:hypothetical protein